MQFARSVPFEKANSSKKVMPLVVLGGMTVIFMLDGDVATAVIWTGA